MQKNMFVQCPPPVTSRRDLYFFCGSSQVFSCLGGDDHGLRLQSLLLETTSLVNVARRCAAHCRVTHVVKVFHHPLPASRLQRVQVFTTPITTRREKEGHQLKKKERKRKTAVNCYRWTSDLGGALKSEVMQSDVRFRSVFTASSSLAAPAEAQVVAFRRSVPLKFNVSSEFGSERISAPERQFNSLLSPDGGSAASPQSF